MAFARLIFLQRCGSRLGFTIMVKIDPGSADKVVSRPFGLGRSALDAGIDANNYGKADQYSQSNTGNWLRHDTLLIHLLALVTAGFLEM
jgi:hypothetical protein